MSGANSSPTYTNAFSALANCYTFLGAMGQMPSYEAYSMAEDYANKSVELNSTRAESYVALGFVNLFSKWNFELAEANFRKAITLEPNDTGARTGLGYVYKCLGEYDRMIHHSKAAAKIEPLSLPIKADLARAYIYSQQSEKSLEVLDEIVELDPLFRMAYEAKSMTYLEMGDLDNAWLYANKYLELVKDPNSGGAFLGYISALRGDTEGIKENLQRLKNRTNENPDLDLSIDFACVYAGLEDFDTAFKYLNQAVDKRLGAMVFLDAMLPFRKMAGDPGFQEIRERIGLPTLKVAAA
jgi:tetratricopeptide (TPR) repeat protein